MACQLITSIDQPFMILEHVVQTHISIGISLYPSDGLTAEVLLDQADAAMYRAKAVRGSAYRFSAQGTHPRSDT
jgi:GGDEF domain-containing protein